MIDRTNPAVASIKKAQAVKSTQFLFFNDEAAGEDASSKYAH